MNPNIDVLREAPDAIDARLPGPSWYASRPQGAAHLTIQNDFIRAGDDEVAL